MLTTFEGSFLCAGLSKVEQEVMSATLLRGQTGVDEDLIGRMGSPVRDRDLGDTMFAHPQEIALGDYPAYRPGIHVGTGIVLKRLGSARDRDGTAWIPCMIVDTAKDQPIVRFFPADLRLRRPDYILADRGPGAAPGYLKPEEAAFAVPGCTCGDDAALREIFRRSLPIKIGEDETGLPTKTPLRGRHFALPSKRILGDPITVGELEIGSPAILEGTADLLIRGMMPPAAGTIPAGTDPKGDPRVAVRVLCRTTRTSHLMWLPDEMSCRPIVAAAVAPSRPAAPPPPRTTPPAAPAPAVPQYGEPFKAPEIGEPRMRGRIGQQRPRPVPPTGRIRKVCWICGPLVWLQLCDGDRILGYAIRTQDHVDLDEFDFGSWDRPLDHPKAEEIFLRLREEEMATPNWIRDPPLDEDHRHEVPGAEPVPM